MVVPDYQNLMLPMLESIEDQKEHKLRDLIAHLSDVFDLSIDEVNELLPSGKQRKFENRVGWARTYLKKAGLLETPSVGMLRITPAGLEVLKKNPSRIDRKFLMQFPGFADFQKVQRKPAWSEYTDLDLTIDSSVSTPTEILEASYRNLRQALAADLLDRIKACSPRFFEDLVLDLLVAMGYGGSRKDAEGVGRGPDGGIDGTINEDKLGLDVVYVQAKRWDKGTVGRPTIAQFVGDLDPKKAKKGVFITTSHFSDDAKDYVKKTDKRIVLIDGDELAQLMIDHGIGVTLENRYDVKKVDADYFSET